MSSEKNNTRTRKQAATPDAENQALDFEQSLNELESLVEEMETGELSLEESLNKFEQGIQLTQNCQNALNKAEQRVNILLEKNGQDTLEPFNGPDDWYYWFFFPMPKPCWYGD